MVRLETLVTIYGSVRLGAHNSDIGVLPKINKKGFFLLYTSSCVFRFLRPLSENKLGINNNNTFRDV